MISIVEQISVFEHPLDYNEPCPNCGMTNTVLLGTTNEYKYGCRDCGKRWNEAREVYHVDEVCRGEA